MFGISTFGSLPICTVQCDGSRAPAFNFRHLILMALKECLESVTMANGFKVDISRVIFGKDGSPLKDREILIYSVRDTAVIKYEGDSVDRNSYLLRPSSKTRNMYVKTRLLVKGGSCGEITSEMVEQRENYADAILKAIYGAFPAARQLYNLLLDGIASEAGLAALEVTQFKEYSFACDLLLETEVLMQYREKFY